MEDSKNFYQSYNCFIFERPNFNKKSVGNKNQNGGRYTELQYVRRRLELKKTRQV
jgi:hypothetical protein